MSPDPPLLAARGVSKRYRGVDALRPTDLELREGESIALLGPNGAGKTTLLRMLAGVSRPSGGELGWRPGAAARVGWVPQDVALYQRLTPRENLRLFAALEGAPDPEAVARDLLSRADLDGFADRPARDLSTGTAQRLNLAIALAGSPSVLLLDEPTATLSPDQRHRLWAWLAGLRAREGLAVAFSTQSVEEAVRHAGRMVVLVGGEVRFSGTLMQLVGGDAPTPEQGERAFMALVAAGDAER